MTETTKFTPPHALKTAVLFLVFNRLDTTKQVFQAIRQAKPPRLYVAADGARANREGESEKVQAVRDYVIQNIDWECKVETLFRDENLGCKYAVSRAITWFFENEEQGVILEDDCLPSQSFFWFCEELLGRYKEDMRIWHIGGLNYQGGIERGDGDYYFSKYNHIWGWASWSSRWKYYDVEMKNLQLFRTENIMKTVFYDRKWINRWLTYFQDTKNSKVDTWDFQWQFTIWSQNGIGVLPNCNLISNVGFGPDATHTNNSNSINANRSRCELTLKNYPTFTNVNVNADEYEYKTWNKKNVLYRLISRAVTYASNKCESLFND